MKIAAGTKDRTIDRTMRSPQADALTRIRFAETATTNMNAGSAEAPNSAKYPRAPLIHDRITFPGINLAETDVPVGPLNRREL